MEYNALGDEEIFMGPFDTTLVMSAKGPEEIQSQCAVDVHDATVLMRSPGAVSFAVPVTKLPSNIKDRFWVNVFVYLPKVPVMLNYEPIEIVLPQGVKPGRDGGHFTTFLIVVLILGAAGAGLWYYRRYKKAQERLERAQRQVHFAGQELSTSNIEDERYGDFKNVEA